MLTTLAREAKSLNQNEKNIIVANAIGFLSQTYEATAGLIGNALIALASQPEIHDSIAAYPELLNPFIQEVLRYDSPVQNTRRYLSEEGFVAGEHMKKGDMILVILAAANRDP